MSTRKWLFGGLGFVLGGPIGAILGVVLGAIFDKIDEQGTAALFGRREDTGEEAYEDDTSYNTGNQRATQGDIRMSLLVLIACVMKADGRVLKSELNYIKPYLLKAYGEDGALPALQMLKQLLEQEIDPVSVSQQIAQHVNYSLRLEIVHMLLELANADDDFADQEQVLIEQISINLGINTEDYESMASIYRKSQDPNWAYTALEITPSASDEEVKKAYRRMAMKYHPDKVAMAGEEIKQQATDKFRSINEAYEHIKVLRGVTS